tara:strand:- start:609 stop:4085 length:3477 start_codon:yes stop_codon:yes gene_type:complete
MTELTPQQRFDELISKYLEHTNLLEHQDKDEDENVEYEEKIFKKGKNNESPEFEIRFGTKGYKKISRNDFDNVVQKLKSYNMTMISNNIPTLKINHEYIDKNGITKQSNIRVEIEGIHAIQQYCKLDTINTNKISTNFVQKYNPIIDDERIRPVDINHYNLRADFKVEKIIDPNSSIVENLKSNWKDNRKTFRYITRTTFQHNDFPIKFDLSIVKEGKKEEITFTDRKTNKKIKKFIPKPEYTIEASDVFNDIEKYEIELEVINNDIISSKYKNLNNLSNTLKKAIRLVLSGLQNTNYPVTYKEIDEIGLQYLKLIHNKDYNDKMRMRSNMFIGPQPITLQMINVSPVNDDVVAPNIRNNYCVTEKADGMRKLLFINKHGKIFLIDTNANIQFTGCITKNVDTFETILDGEHILHNKYGDFINLYAAFDIYFINKKDIRANPFIPNINSTEIPTKFRLNVLVGIIENLNAVSSFSDTSISPMRFENKQFRASNESKTIFESCNDILSQEKQGLFEYEVDGLIFTPIELGAGGNFVGEAGPLKKHTWEHAFKWKPPEFNTIDFLVSTKKDSSRNNDFVGSIFQDGINASSYEQLSQYKTLILKVGFDEERDGYINPCSDVINDKIPSLKEENEKSFKPLQFFGTEPFDAEAGICNVMLETDESGNKQLLTEEKEVFGEGIIVEFKYDMTRENKWRWLPLRVRYDKTEEYRKGNPQYGNSYKVANSNWKSIHNPITQEMIRTGENIPNEIANDDIYYNKKSNFSQTKGLRDFHRLFIKKKLINMVSKKGYTLIDYAVGKAGDLSKWIDANLSFVFGIDYSKDNIENRVDGACARYLNDRRKFKVMPQCLFVHGDSSENIRNTDAIKTEKNKQITKAVFGEGPKEKDNLGMGVYKQYGKGSEGFNISSCQFALHYFFNDKKDLNNFLKNVSECTKINGHFIGTCYDGRKIFDALKNKNIDDSMSLFVGGKKIWQITKNYEHTTFEDDETSLGYKINVFQETINKSFPEYLVNFDYLNRLMENYGFVLLNKSECLNIGIPSSVGSFRQLYGLLEQENKKNPKNVLKYGEAINMTPEEKQISFYNNYFIYKKIRNVDTNAVFNTMTGTTKYQEEFNKLEEKEASESANNEQLTNNSKKSKPKNISRKIKKKLRLKDDEQNIIC